MKCSGCGDEMEVNPEAEAEYAPEKKQQIENERHRKENH